MGLLSEERVSNLFVISDSPDRVKTNNILLKKDGIDNGGLSEGVDRTD